LHKGYSVTGEERVQGVQQEKTKKKGDHVADYAWNGKTQSRKSRRGTTERNGGE